MMHEYIGEDWKLRVLSQDLLSLACQVDDIQWP